MCILVVEDDTLIRMLLVEELLDAGYTVREAATADEALKMLPCLDVPLSLVVTDIHMPGEIDGVALASRLRKAHPLLPIIFTTGRPDVLIPLARLDAFQSLMRKPYTPYQIMDCIHQFLGDAPLNVGNAAVK